MYIYQERKKYTSKNLLVSWVRVKPRSLDIRRASSQKISPPPQPLLTQFSQAWGPTLCQCSGYIVEQLYDLPTCSYAREGI